MNRDDILGPWLLISMRAKSRDGDVFYPFCESPAGMIMYDASGYMSYTAMSGGRPFASGDAFGGSPEEIKAAFEGFDAYCGSYDVNLTDQVITHHVEASKFPNWEGSEQVRLFDVSGNQLKIETRPMQFRGTEWVIHVLFERPPGFETIG